MKQRTYEKLIYAGASIPLTTGTLIFIVWHHRKYSYALDTDFEWTVFLVMMSFLLLCGLAAIALGIVYLKKFTKNWKRVVPAVYILLLTIPVAEAYKANFDFAESQTFIRIVNDDAGIKVRRIWSKHFESTYFSDENDFTIWLEPVYIYDWVANGSGPPAYAISDVTDVFIDLASNDDQIMTFKFPKLRNGCYYFKISELINGQGNTTSPSRQ